MGPRLELLRRTLDEVADHCLDRLYLTRVDEEACVYAPDSNVVVPISVTMMAPQNSGKDTGIWLLPTAGGMDFNGSAVATLEIVVPE